jgi:hypothetical protein
VGGRFSGSLLFAVLAAVWARRRSKLAQQEDVIEYFTGMDKQGQPYRLCGLHSGCSPTREDYGLA